MSEAETRKKIAELESQIESERKLIDKHHQNISFLKTEIESLEMQLDESRYCDAVVSFLSSAENYREISIYSDTPTRQIITDIYYDFRYISKDHKPFDYLILNGFYIFVPDYLFRFGNIEAISTFTATELKNSCVHGAFYNAMYADKTVLLKSGKFARPFVKPYIMRAQTDENSYGNTEKFYFIAKILYD